MWGNISTLYSRPFYVDDDGDIVDEIVEDEEEEYDPYAYEIGTIFTDHDWNEYTVVDISEQNVTFKSEDESREQCSIYRDLFESLLSHGCLSLKDDD